MPKEYGIKPYIDETHIEEGQVESDHVDMMRRPTWDNQSAVVEEKHSEFVKPYEWDDYNQQEHFYPNPIFNPEWPFDQPTTEVIVDRQDILGCLITCMGNFARDQDDCEFPIRCRFLTVSGSSSRADPDRVKIYKTDAIGNILEEIKLPRVSFQGLDRFEIRPPNSASDGWGDYVIPGHGNEDHAHIRIEYEDINGSICSDNVQMYCAACTCPSGDFAFDDASTPDTISAGGSITVYVTGGCPTYSWSITAGGTGYSLDNASTSGVSNVLNCDSGTCDSDFDSYVEITVTDFCSDTVTFVIYSADGSWEFCASAGGFECSSGDPTASDDVYITPICRFVNIFCCEEGGQGAIIDDQCGGEFDPCQGDPACPPIGTDYTDICFLGGGYTEWDLDCFHC